MGGKVEIDWFTAFSAFQRERGGGEFDINHTSRFHPRGSVKMTRPRKRVRGGEVHKLLVSLANYMPTLSSRDMIQNHGCRSEMNIKHVAVCSQN